MFDEYFEVVLADTPTGLNTHFNVRYQVYCEEMGYEDKSRFPDELEADAWDEHSVHFLIRHKHTHQWIGAMRMVFPHNGELPMQEFCPIDREKSNHVKEIEISRLCLINDIRKRKTDKEPPLGLNTKADPHTLSNDVTQLYSRRHINKSLIWGLFRAASLYSQAEGIENWYFLGSKALARVISREGFKMQQIGEGCEHRGKRYPFKVEMQHIIDNEIWSRSFNNGYTLYSELAEAQQLRLNAA
jgi:N-acyl amino acid synthase of PEP-CTERM/exosortase system